MKSFIKKIKDKRIRESLVYSIWDGILWAVMFGLGDNYLVPFAIAIGATALQVSFITGSGQVAISFSQLIGANFIEKYRKRKKLSVLCNRIHAISWLFIFFVTYITKNPYFIIIFYFIGIFATSFAGPGWLAWQNEIVPAKLRGEFWGVRNKLIGLTQFLSICFGGILLHYFSKTSNTILAFGILFTLAFIGRYLSIFPLSRQYEPPMKVSHITKRFNFITFLSKMHKSNFGRFVLFSIFMTFAVNIMAPIIPVFLLKSLKYNYFEYMVITLTAMVTSFLSMTYWGPLADKYGNYRILYITSIGLPIIALCWSLSSKFYFLILIQMFAGFVWAGFNLSTLNFIFDAIRPENIAKASAYFNILNNLTAFLGSVTGGTLTKFLPTKGIEIFNFTQYNYEIIFLISFLFRLLIVLLFIKTFKEVRKVEKSPPIHYFYFYRPALNIMNRFLLRNYNKKFS